MNDTEINTKSEKIFYKYLKNELAFPEESIAYAYKIDGKYEADFVILDKSTNLPIMLFEVKGIRNARSEESARKILKKFGSVIKNYSLRLYMVFLNEDGKSFQIEELDSQTGVTIDVNPDIWRSNYKAIRNARLSETANKKDIQKKAVIDKLSLISWILAFMLFAFYITFKFLGYKFDAIDLSVMGGVIGLILLPYANKIRFIGIEYERYIRAKEEG